MPLDRSFEGFHEKRGEGDGSVGSSIGIGWFVWFWEKYNRALSPDIRCEATCEGYPEKDGDLLDVIIREFFQDFRANLVWARCFAILELFEYLTYIVWGDIFVCIV